MRSFVQGVGAAPMKRRVAVTGVTGRQGGATARCLLAEGFAVRGLARRPATPAARAMAACGVELVECDLEDPASLRAALHGADGLFLTTTPYEDGLDAEERQAGHAIDAALAEDVGQIVYTSVAGADAGTGVAHYESKGRIEARLKAADFRCVTILRPTFFMDMFLGPAFRRAVAEGEIRMILRQDSAFAMIAVEDIGRVAATAFACPQDFAGRTIDLAGDCPTMARLAAAVSTAVGRPIAYVQVAPDALDADVKPRVATQRWLEEVGWTLTGDALPRDLRLTGIVEWTLRHRSELMAKPEGGTP